MATNLIGRTLLKQFRVEEFIGYGGMAAVYRVWDLKRDAPLAMKVLHSDLADDPSIFKHFQREARALSKLTHPHIVPFYGLYHVENFSFLLEGYIDGPTLKSSLRKRQDRVLPLMDTLSIIKVISSALGYAHSNRVVHCDVKPSNIIFDLGGNIFLTDFGIARHAESTITTMGPVGTPAYMAPEQIRGEPVSPASDIYTLGLLLFEMLTGQKTFHGNEVSSDKAGSTTNQRISHAHLYLPPPDPCSLNPSLPKGLTRVIVTALSKNPNERYQSTRKFQEATFTAIGINEAEVPNRIKEMPENSSLASSKNYSRLQGQTMIPKYESKKSGNIPVWLWIFIGVVIIGTLFGLSYKSNNSIIYLNPVITPSLTSVATNTLNPTLSPTYPPISTSIPPTERIVVITKIVPVMPPTLPPTLQLNRTNCNIKIGQEVQLVENSRVWTQPDVIRGEISKSLTYGVRVVIIGGPTWGRVQYNPDTSGWWWEIGDASSFGKIGWVWEGRIDICR